MTASNLEIKTVVLKSGNLQTPTRPTIREARFEDYSQIATLESSYGLRPKNYEEWKHLWTGNPVYQELKGWPIGWVCEKDGEIVGYIGNIPLAYEFDGQPVTTATSRALVAHKGYRPYSFSLLGCFFDQKSVDLFINTSINDKVMRLQELCRAERVPTGKWDRASFWITNYRGFTASVLEKSGFMGSQALSYPVSAGLFFRDELTGRGRSVNSDSEAACCSSFDERFDRFWMTIRGTGSGKLLAVRTSEMLNWHFHYALAKGDAWVVTIENKNGLAAYGIFCRQDNPNYRLSRVRMVDFQVLPGNEDSLEAILSYAVARCRREGIHMLEAIGFSSEKQAMIEKIAPYRRDLTSWRYFYKANAAYLSSCLTRSSAWDATCYDGDCSL
ncbi:MAG TPA: hypothetical protein VMH89_14390 [Candidatus Acidoferrum sp.]|nr:hypothetical protein [Candidatus Acidoferrum sp.]